MLIDNDKPSTAKPNIGFSRLPKGYRDNIRKATPEKEKETNKFVSGTCKSDVGFRG